MDKRKRRLLCMLEGSGRKSRWISGTPPLSYKAKKAGRLSDYRIYGNTVDGNSVGDLVESGEHAGEYVVPVTVEGKNLFKITKFANGPVSLTVSGITFTISNNKVIYSGTSTATYPQVLSPELPLIPGESYYAKIMVKGTYEGLAYIFFNGRETPESMRVNYKMIKYSTEEVFTAWYNTSVLYVAEGNNKHFDASVEVVITKVPSVTTHIYLPEPIKMVGDEAEYIDYAEQKQHVTTTYMVSITPKTDVSKIVFVTMSSVPKDCTILISGLIFTLDEADANTLNSTNYADGVRGNASTAHNYKYTWTKRYTEGETYYIRSYVKYQTADNEIKEVYGDVYKADINGFERVRKNLLPNTATSQTINTELDVTLPALPTLPGANVLSVGTAVQPSEIEVKGKIKDL